MNIEWLRKNFEKKRFRIQTRTIMYISPCFKVYSDLVPLVNQFYCTAAGLYDKEKSIEGINVYFLLNIQRKNKTKAAELLTQLRKHISYKTDYPFGDLLYDQLHMLVLKVPEKYHKDVINFKLGRYSELFKKDRDKLFNKDSLSYKVITKDDKVAKEITASFGTIGKEYDSPPIMTEEGFNHDNFNPKQYSILFSDTKSKLNWL